MRAILNTPKAITRISPRTAEVIKYANFLLLGFHINLDDLPVDLVNDIEYYGMKRRAKEEEERFKALAKMLGAK